MKKYIFSLVCLCCALLPALEGQAHEYPNHPELRKSDANIVGHILDKNTKEHLPYITVALKGTTIGTVTDATGHYFLKNLPEGNFVLEVSSVGYKTVRRNVTLKKGRTLEEDFEIEEDAVALDGVVVSANRNETTRRLAPTLVNVVDLKIFENTNSTTLAQGLSFQPGVRVELIVRIAASSKCASMDWMVLIRKSCSIPVPFLVHCPVCMASSRFLPV